MARFSRIDIKNEKDVKKIRKLKNIKLHRKRVFRVFGYGGGKSFKDIPLHSPEPEATAFTDQEDFLFIEGLTEKGREKTLSCGAYSKELLDHAEEIIKEINSN